LLAGRAAPWRFIIAQTIPRHAADPLDFPPLEGRRAIVAPRRLEGPSAAERPDVRRLSVRRPTVARRAVVDVDVVVVTRHGRDRVLACLNNLAIGADGAVMGVTVVDNGSNDGTCEAVAARGDGTRVLDMGFDTGMATAANAGMARGRGRYILLLDPDTVMTPGSVRTLVEFADQHPEAGVVAPRLLAGQVPSSATAEPDEAAFELDWVSGRAMLVPRVVHAATAGFDEGYVSFFAARDWCQRIKAAGYSVWCVPSATAVYQQPRSVEREERRSIVRSYYAGAYRYWLQHDAPPPWHPWRWVQALLLTVRSTLATMTARDLPPVGSR